MNKIHKYTGFCQWFDHHEYHWIYLIIYVGVMFFWISFCCSHLSQVICAPLQLRRCNITFVKYEPCDIDVRDVDHKLITIESVKECWELSLVQPDIKYIEFKNNSFVFCNRCNYISKKRWPLTFCYYNTKEGRLVKQIRDGYIDCYVGLMITLLCLGSLIVTILLGVLYLLIDYPIHLYINRRLIQQMAKEKDRYI